MTVIVAIKKDGVVYMGADTCSSTETSFRLLSTDKKHSEYGKIRLFDNGLIVGFSGSASAVSHLCEMKGTVFSFADGELTKERIVNGFFPAATNILKEGKCVYDDGEWKCSIVMAKGDRLFRVFGNKDVYEYEDFVSIGSGCVFAYGSLSMTDGAPEERILEACRMASKFRTCVHGPYVVANTKDRKIREVK